MPIGMREDAYRLVVEMILKSRQHPTNESFAEHARTLPLKYLIFHENYIYLDT